LAFWGLPDGSSTIAANLEVSIIMFTVRPNGEVEMDNSCKPINVLPIDRFGLATESTDCNKDQTARRLLDAVAPSTVKIETGEKPFPRLDSESKVGSGLIVNDGSEVLTNAHVGLSGSFVDVITSDGKRYHAQLSKLDEINDLARFKVLGLAANPSRAAKVDVTPLKAEEELVTYGHPGGAPEIWTSTGHYKGKDTLEKLVPDPKAYPDLLTLIALKNSPDQALAKMANDYLASERIVQRAHIEHGNSGGPSFDGSQNLRAVAANRISVTRSLFIPADKVKAAIEEPEQKFKFNYQSLADGSSKLTSIERLDGSSTPPIVLGSSADRGKLKIGRADFDTASKARLGLNLDTNMDMDFATEEANVPGRENFRNPILRLNYYEQKARK
jgi:S1-C subfamily serine protease